MIFYSAYINGVEVTSMSKSSTWSEVKKSGADLQPSMKQKFKLLIDYNTVATVLHTNLVDCRNY